MILLTGCADTTTYGPWTVEGGEGLTLSWNGEERVNDLRFATGTGDETFEMQTGAYRLVDGETTWTDGTGTLALSEGPGESLLVTVLGDGNRVRWSAACAEGAAFVGGGEHAFDVDHAGERFALWVSEPGVGKVDTEDTPDDWFLTGTRHASSYPDPFFLTSGPVGVAALTDARVEVDLCAGDRWTLDAWQGSATFLVQAGETPIDVVRAHALLEGPPAMPPDWAFAPWNDAVRGQDRVREVAALLRGAGAPSSVIWTEDWKGAQDTSFGYHLLPEWEVDRTLYPEVEAVDAELEALGFKWFAYFSPFLVEGSGVWEEAKEHAADCMFTGVTFEPTTTLDLSSDAARAWTIDKMRAALDLGFDGWMADYAEWLPTDCALDAADPLEDHNAYPLWWQELNAEAVAGREATFFTRSGWTGSPQRSPIHWPGDQRTSFDPDDGLPSVVPMMLGTSIAGVPLTGSDIAGYQSLGNEPSTKELWFRWASLGAFSPIMRTHHGAFADDNWQFDSDEETLAHFAAMAGEHVRLFPYLRGLLEDVGVPLLRPLFWHHPAEPWGRADAYLLGPSLLVRPVVEAGATEVAVSLPAGDWWDWWTGARATTGPIPSPVTHIPVFAARGAVIPLYAQAPDTLVDGPLPGVVTRADVDGSRIIRVYGGGGAFTEADGTAYVAAGTATGGAEAVGTFDSGSVEAGGVTLSVEGGVVRSYRLVVYD